jgi:hypothetical protein
VVPVHTHKEYITFKAHINHTKFRKGTKVYPPHEHWKNIDFLKFAQFWNELVDAQPRSVTDSNLRLYYKLPQQLEAHHKKTILWKSECATLSDGSNFAGRKQLLDILNSPDNYADTIPAIPLPEPMPDGELDLSIARSYDSFCHAGLTHNYVYSQVTMIQHHLIRWPNSLCKVKQVIPNSHRGTMNSPR